MFEEFEYKGNWWLPDEPEKQTPGTLRFNPREGAVLDLIGSFKDITIESMFKMLSSQIIMLSPQIILGTSSNGKDITLYKCLETKLTPSFPGIPLSSFYAHVVFVGTHFQRPEDIKFKKVYIHYLHLDEWVDLSGFNIEIPPSPSKDEIIIKYKLPIPVEVSLKDDYRMRIAFGFEGPTLSAVQKEAGVKQETYIKIEASEEKPFEEHMRIIHMTQDFLSLGVGEPVYPLTIEGTTEVGETVKSERTPVGVFYSPKNIPKVTKTLLPFEMLFTFKDIKAKFGVLLNNWFEKAELLEPVYGLYFGTLYDSRMYSEHRFLSLIQAVESYHSRVTENCELPQERHNKRIEEILTMAPPNHKDWLRSKLEYSNHPILRKRLREIYDKYSTIVNFEGDGKAFVHKVWATRNYFTHFDKKLKAEAAEGEELYHITQKLKILLEACLLAELGFSLNEIENLFSRSKANRLSE